MEDTLFTAVVIPDDYAFELTRVEENILFSLVFDIEKAKRRTEFVRQGMNRRQDHGTGGNVLPKDCDVEEWKVAANKRRDFWAAGRQITGTL